EGIKSKKESCIETSSVFCSSGKIPIDQPLWVNDSQIQRAQLAGYAAARRKEILEHQAQGNPVLGEFFLTHIAYAVGFLLLLQNVDNVAAASFFVTVKIT